MVSSIPCHPKMEEWDHCEGILDQIKTLALLPTTHFYVLGWVCSLYWVSLADFPQPWPLCSHVVSNTIHALLPPLHTVASQGFPTATPMPHTTHCLASATLWNCGRRFHDPIVFDFQSSHLLVDMAKFDCPLEMDPVLESCVCSSFCLLLPFRGWKALMSLPFISWTTVWSCSQGILPFIPFILTEALRNGSNLLNNYSLSPSISLVCHIKFPIVLFPSTVYFFFVSFVLFHCRPV